jgi:hypothetical protein
MGNHNSVRSSTAKFDWLVEQTEHLVLRYNFGTTEREK